MPPIPLFDPMRAEAAMAASGIDVVLATTRNNVSYLAGYFCHHISRLPFYLDDGSRYNIIAAVARDPDTPPFSHTMHRRSQRNGAAPVLDRGPAPVRPACCGHRRSDADEQLSRCCRGRGLRSGRSRIGKTPPSVSR